MERKTEERKEMIQNLNCKAKDRVIIEADVNGVYKEIFFSDIELLWNYANEDEFKSGRVYVFRKYIAFSMLVANSQCGIIVLLDTETKYVANISEAAYCKAFTLYNDALYYLCDVCNFTTPSHIRVFAVPLHTMDAWQAGERIYCQTPCIIYDRENPYKSVDIEASVTGILVKFDNMEVRCSDTLDTNALSKRNEDFAWVYDVFTEEQSNGTLNMDRVKVFGWLT